MSIRQLKLFHQPYNDSWRQSIRFVEREPTVDSKALFTKTNGTTVRAVISVLIDELIELDKIIPCQHNKDALRGLNIALEALNDREVDRHRRGVEGTHNP